jgi:hypothetical protein
MPLHRIGICTICTESKRLVHSADVCTECIKEKPDDALALLGPGQTNSRNHFLAIAGKQPPQPSMQ